MKNKERIGWIIALILFSCIPLAYAASKITDLTELSATPASGDLIAIVDVSDTTMAATGTTKKIQYSNLVPTGIADGNVPTVDGSGVTENEAAVFTDSGVTGMDEPTFKSTFNLEADTDYYAPSGTDVPVVDGGTGASTAAGARTNLDVDQSRAVDSGITTFGDGDTITPAGTAKHMIASVTVTDDPSGVTIDGDTNMSNGYTFKLYNSGASSYTVTDVNDGYMEIPSTTGVGKIEVPRYGHSTWEYVTDRLVLVGYSSNVIFLSEFRIDLTANGLSEDTGTGISAGGKNAGEDIDFGEAVYWDNANAEWMLADNTGIDTSTTPDRFKGAEGISISSGTISNGSELIVLKRGFARNDDWAFTAGRKVFLSTSGTLTQSRSIAAAGFVQEVGTAITDDELWVDPKPIDWSCPRYGTTAVEDTWNAIEVYNTVWTVSGATTVNLPAVAEVPVINMTVIAAGAVAVVVNPDDSDKFIYVDGAATWDDGDSITSGATAGESTTIMTGTTDGPVAQTTGWTDED